MRQVGKLMAVLAATLVLGCGADLGGGSSNNGCGGNLWQISGDTVTCCGSDSQSQDTIGGTQFYECVWDCTTYNGNDYTYVDVTFDTSSGSWAVSDLYTADGICG